MNRYSLCFHWYLISKARLPKAKAVGDVVSQKLPINILLFMSISQNLACACCHTGLQSGLSWLSSPDRWSKAQHFLLYTLQKASYIIWRIVLNHQLRYCQEVERRQNSQQSSKRKWELWKIIRFPCGITVTWVRNLYTGNLYFDPDMQKVDTLTGTIHMVIWTRLPQHGW